ncbi:FGGY-family carbohydrate kinase [Sphingobacterium psychroaquaticum]|uniref:Sugar (Pentulose or hexulose) kinase n=1 Tax=Sphingobacterium psychroaquaticum TaxID=561061 RepID=A0A1X7JAF1_9SPHI|nr:FGGY family carbohydrate kinase [Sphingobacterium psychroaquaticum]SMG24820.1 Sugar (pentulose or hexulose) kinase [Sphingobacterium psychroaquaticum]
MSKVRIPVIAIFDVGKTNKKLFLFDEHYQIVFERSARFLETTDEDGFPCENLESLRLSVFDSLHEVFRRDEFDIKAINFTSYGASFVYLDENGRPLTPLYNYLKEYPEEIQNQLYENQGGEDTFSLATASPALGSLNSGLQLLRLKVEQPVVFRQVKYAVHLPQYLSFLVSGKIFSDMTSIGCHTALWNFTKKEYHQWVTQEGLNHVLAPIVQGNEVFDAAFPGSPYRVGAGLHDSSSALIPYLLNFHEPFILISTGTWCISMNPFNAEELTKEELDKDTLFYMTYSGTPVKASRLFAGYEHEQQTKRIADHFGTTSARFRNMEINWDIVNELKREPISADLSGFSTIDLERYQDVEEAYHALVMHLVEAQVASTALVRSLHTKVTRIFVDGGFSKNNIYMNLLAAAFSDVEVYAASMAQATAIGAALVIHEHWNSLSIPNNIIELRFFRH